MSGALRGSRAVGLVGGVLGTALLATGGAAQAVSTERGHWELDETTGTVAADSSGLGNDGESQDTVGTGTGYVFNGTSARVVVPHDDSLNPGAEDFSISVTVSLTQAPPAKESYDVLRKGLARTQGGHYKLEIKNAKGRAVARCMVKDADGNKAAIRSRSRASDDLADGEQHTITCAKTATGISLTVDAVAPRTRTVSTLGTVANDSDLGLGAKAEDTTRTGFDWFLGTMYDASVAMG